MKMRWATLWKVLPVPIVAFDRMPHRLVGLSMGMFVVVRSDHLGDRPTIVHELEHCKQFWRGGALVHMVRYYLSRCYRLRMEVEAFRAELAACEPEDREARLDDAVRALASGYHVGIDAQACRHLLTCFPPSDDFSATSPGATPPPLTSSPAVMARSTDSTPR